MEFENLLTIVGDEPVFESALLLAGKVSPQNIRLQLSRWMKSGKIYQLRRGLYCLAPPYQKVKPHPFVIANRLQRSSYVSAQSALAFYGMIPETIHSTLSVTTGRPERLVTQMGIFEFRHIHPSLLHGYRMTALKGQQALVATPEKALFDLIYLQPGADSYEYLQSLRLQNFEQLNLAELHLLVEKLNKPKLRRATEHLSNLANHENKEYEAL